MPDDIEQFLIAGQSLRGAVALRERRRISIEESRDWSDSGYSIGSEQQNDGFCTAADEAIVRNNDDP